MAPVPPPQEGNVAVMVRVRPPAPSEREGVLHHPVLNVVNQHMLIFNPEVSSSSSSSSSRHRALPARKPKSHSRGLQFIFDRVFGEEATQEEVFQHTTRGLLDSVLNGCNCSVFAYGATGAGKTYTMLGSEESPGIMYRTMVELYQKIKAEKPERSCEVLVSYLEVYNEQIHDLLMPKGPLAIREDPEKGVMVQGLSFHQPTTAKQLLEMLASGNKNRTQHPTDANASSSRSHAIFQVHVKQQGHAGDLAGQVQVAKMSLVDLAGSERASVTNTRGERLREGANINRSLLALVNVITALADPKSKKTHVPYRDSKLTHLLKDSIGGNCRTIMVAAVSLSSLAYEDTYNTLKYAGRAKEIKQSLKNNMLTADCHVCQCPMPCQQLRAEVAELREKLCAYKEAVETPPGSLGAAQQTDLQLSSRKGRRLLQGWSGSQPERLLAALLSFAVKQHSLLQAADLLTPDVASEWEELERLVRQESGVSLEPATAPRRATTASRCPLAQRTRLGCDAEASVNVPSAPVLDAALQGLQQLSPIPSAKLLTLSSIRKRRRLLETNSASQAGSPGCNLPAVPTSIMNVTFEICSSDTSPGTAQPAATSQPEFSILKSIQNTLDKNKGSLVAKASSIPRAAVKGSSIPKPSSLSQAARWKWSGQESSPWPSKGGSQNLLPKLPHSSQRSSKPSRLPAHPSGRLAWKGCRRTPRTQPALSSRHLTSTPQLVKLLC